MTSYNELFARPACWVVTRKGKDIARVYKHRAGYVIELRGEMLTGIYMTLELALRAIDRRI